MVKTRPILFTAEMVKAILDGRKQQTRRLVRWRPCESGLNLAFSALELGYYSDDPASGYVLRSRGAGSCWNDRTYPAHSPYGVAGDLLWVREEHYRFGHWEPADGPRKRTKTGRQRWQFVADHDEVRFDVPASFRGGRHHKDPSTPAWHKRLGRFMPRSFSRITLEVTQVRVQRILEITEADAQAEGVDGPHFGRWTDNEGRTMPPENRAPRPWAHSFALAWDKINGRESWFANAHVWAISFRLVVVPNERVR